MIRLWCFVLFVLSTLGAHAIDVRNPNALPMGHEEGLMGNAGVALYGSPGNPYFNPAAMDEDKNMEFSAASQSLTVSFWQLVADSSTTDNATTSIFTSPNLVISSGYGRWAFALSMFTPVNIRLESEITETTGTSKSTLISEQEESILVGASAKYAMNRRLSLGATLFLERYSDNYFVSVKQVDGTSASDFIAVVRDNRQIVSFYPVLGAHYKWNKNFFSGLRLQLPNLQVQGDTDHYNGSKGTNKTATIDDEFTDIFGANQKTPIDLVLGNWLRWGRSQFVADFGFQLPTTFNTIEDSRTGSSSESERIATTGTLRFHLGYRFKWNENLTLLLGYQGNPSTVLQEVDDLEFGVELDKDTQNINQVTGGLSYRRNRFELAVGMYYNSGTYVFFDSSEFGTENSRESTLQTVGGYLSTRVAF